MCEKKIAARSPGFQKHAERGIEIPYPTLFPLRNPNPNPMKTRNLAPARNLNSRFRITHPAKSAIIELGTLCAELVCVLLTKEGYINVAYRTESGHCFLLETHSSFEDEDFWNTQC